MDSQSASRKPTAERDALLGLAAILTHDLSNPLQSITVLCELGLDADDREEAPLRARQCLEAAERMRTLIHSYASLIRGAGRRGVVAGAMERMLPMFDRRFERYRVEVHTHCAGEFVGPPSSELALLSLLLGLVEAAAEGPGGPYEADLAISDNVISAALHTQEGTAAGWPPNVVDDLRAILSQGEGSVALEEATLRVTLESPAA